MESSKCRNSFSSEILDRLLQPWKTLYFLYFIGFVIGIGSMGIWYSLYSEGWSTGVITNISTYFIAILSTSVVSIINSKTLKNQKTFNVLSVLVLIIGFILFIVANDKNSYLIGIIGYILSLMFWIIATSDDPTLKETSIKAAIDEGQKKHGKDW
jgi:predicted neutral ceramidase superfamily lipid hydrolase